MRNLQRRRELTYCRLLFHSDKVNNDLFFVHQFNLKGVTKGDTDVRQSVWSCAAHHSVTSLPVSLFQMEQLNSPALKIFDVSDVLKYLRIVLMIRVRVLALIYCTVLQSRNQDSPTIFALQTRNPKSEVFDESA